MIRVFEAGHFCCQAVVYYNVINISISLNFIVAIVVVI